MGLGWVYFVILKLRNLDIYNNWLNGFLFFTFLFGDEGLRYVGKNFFI